MKVVFFGSSHYVIPVIEELKNNFGLSLVVTTEKNPTDPVHSYSIKSKLQYYVVLDSSAKNLVEKIKEIRPDIGVLASFGQIVPREILDLFPNGILNIHPSLLPRYRGPTPVQTAILNEDKKTGATIIKLDEKIDHGPILAQEEEEILADDTTLSLQKRLFEKGAKLVGSMIRTIELGKKAEEISQDDSNATYTTPLTRDSGLIDLKSPPSKQVLERMLRAYFPWPGVWFKTLLNGKEVIVKLLPEKIQVEGKKPMSYKDFVNGYKEGKQVLEILGYGGLRL